jgi:arylsulfatase A-like enzyme
MCSSSPSTRSARIAWGLWRPAGDDAKLDRLARRGVTFMDATAHAPLTAPSHASILTGQYPPHHELRDNAGLCCRHDRGRWQSAARRGYHLAAFVASCVLNRGTGPQPRI